MGNNILGIFNGGDIQDISALVDKLERSSFDYMKLEGDGISIVIGKNGAGEADILSAPSIPAAAPMPAASAVPEAPAGAEPAGASFAPVAEEPAPGPAVSEQDGVTVVRSPNYGLFYSQSEPGAPPYVKIGDAVKLGDTVGLLETMKTFTAISSPVDGEVVAIHVKNEEMLEPDQPLVSIRTGI